MASHFVDMHNSIASRGLGYDFKDTQGQGMTWVCLQAVNTVPAYHSDHRRHLDSRAICDMLRSPAVAVFSCQPDQDASFHRKDCSALHRAATIGTSTVTPGEKRVFDVIRTTSSIDNRDVREEETARCVCFACDWRPEGGESILVRLSLGHKGGQASL